MADITQIFYELSVMADILVKKSFQFFHSYIAGLPARDIYIKLLKVVCTFFIVEVLEWKDDTYGSCRPFCQRLLLSP